MPKKMIIPAIFASLFLAISLVQAKDGRAHLGMNLAGPVDWNTELPFVNVFYMSRPWISQKKGTAWGKGPDLSLDERGWVKKLDRNCWAETLLCTISGGHYPSGTYTVLYDGKGQIDFSGGVKLLSRQPGKILINVDSRRGAFFLRIKDTDPSDYIRNIRVIMPGFADSWQQNPWHPVFLKRWQGMAVLRFMDFMHTNNSLISRWSQRPQPGDATFSKKGVPLELMIDLANRLHAAPWFCMPHRADDDYIRNFARMVHDRLDKKLKVYVEYSNEVWNGMFAQNHYAGEQGMKLGFAEKPWEAGWRYTAYRSLQIFRIWEDIFGDARRVVRILPSQAANPYVSRRIVEWQDAYKHADALAIAPYISCIITPNGKRINTSVAGKWSVDDALDYMEKVALPQAIEWMKRSKAVADEHGLLLLAYEGGQHMVGAGGAENNAKLTRLLQAANRHPRMGMIYRKYFRAWQDMGGDMFCYFSSVSRWSKWGSWGLLQYYDDDPVKSPKFMATIEWARQLGQPVHLPR